MQNSCNLIYVYTNVHSYEHFGVFAFVRERQRESVRSHVYVYVSKKFKYVGKECGQDWRGWSLQRSKVKKKYHLLKLAKFLRIPRGKDQFLRAWIISCCSIDWDGRVRSGVYC